MSYKILVVDDDKELRESLAENLEIKGYSVLTAKTGLEGKELFLKEKPDIVLVEACSLNDTQAARQKKSDQMRIAEAAQELLNNGMIDAIVARRETSEVLRRVLNFVC